jgi:hypothetical protein
MQPMIESNVVFPLPEGPISSNTSPRKTSKSTPFNARTAATPEPNTLSMDVTEAIGSDEGFMP